MSGTRARGPRTVVGLLAALGLIAALAMPALAVEEEPDWAAVTGYAPGTSDNNHADTWGEGCVKLPTPEGGWGMTYELPTLPDGDVYTLVIVKAGSDQSTEEGANTLFANPSAGETVWADADGSGTFSDGDKTISHIIVCTGDEPDEEPEERSATVTVIKQADDDPNADFTFTPDVGDDFVLSDNGSKTFTFDDEDFGEGTSIEFGVAEDILAAEGWELTDIDCGDNPAASVNLAAAGFLATLEDGDAVTCTFVNELTDEGGEEPNEEEPPREDQEGGNPTPTPAGELPDTAAGAFTGVPAALVALLMIAALTATAYTRVARQR